MQEIFTGLYGDFRDMLPSSAQLLLDALLAAKEEIQKALIYVYSTGKNIYGKTERGFDAVINRILVEKLKMLEFCGNIVSEEGNIMGECGDTIFLDPIDGSLNVVKGIPVFAVSMAYSRNLRYTDITSGVIWVIPLNEVFLGVKGIGAFKISKHSNSSKAAITRITATRRDREATLIDVGLTASSVVESLRDLGEIRMTGSVAFSLAKVAEGYLDAFFDVSGLLKLSDVAAGLPLLSEAGARYEIIPIGAEENPRVLFLASCDPELFLRLKKIFEGEVQDFSPL